MYIVEYCHASNVNSFKLLTVKTIKPKELRLFWKKRYWKLFSYQASSLRLPGFAAGGLWALNFLGRTERHTRSQTWSDICKYFLDWIWNEPKIPNSFFWLQVNQEVLNVTILFRHLPFFWARRSIAMQHGLLGQLKTKCIFTVFKKK